MSTTPSTPDPDDFKALIPSGSDDFCTAFRKTMLQMPKLLWDLIRWMVDEDTGNPTQEFVNWYNLGPSQQAASDGTPPSPLNLTASTSFAGYVQLGWSEADEADSYSIWRSKLTDTAADQQLSANAEQIGTSTDTGYQDTTAVSGKSYYYWVKAINGLLVSGFSNRASGTRSGALVFNLVTSYASATEVVLAGAGTLELHAWGAGGQGGRGGVPVVGAYPGWTYGAGGGGGAGGYASTAAVAVAVGDTLRFTIGAPGKNGTANGNGGANTTAEIKRIGTTTWLEILTCFGGAGGKAGSASGGGNGGTGGNAELGAGIAGLSQSGNDGSPGSLTVGSAGGAGGSAYLATSGGEDLITTTSHGSGGAGGEQSGQNGISGLPGLIRYRVV